MTVAPWGYQLDRTEEIPSNSLRARIKMNRTEIFLRLNKVFQAVFKDDSILVTESTASPDIRDWDSLNHITLIMAVEDEFATRFNLGDLQELQNVGALVDLIVRSPKLV